MVKTIISSLLIIIGLIALMLEVLFSITLFNYSGATGFVILFTGITLLTRNAGNYNGKIKKKHLGQFPGGGSPGGVDGG